MSFLDAVPAQQAALDYVERFASLFPGSLRLGGHSKGGNLAVFAGALARIKVRDRILAIYNNDGPGFDAEVIALPGYQAIKGWLAGLSPQERSQFVDSLFHLLSAGEASTTADLLQPRSLQAALRSLADDRDGTRRTLVEGLIQLARSAASVWRENVP